MTIYSSDDSQIAELIIQIPGTINYDKKKLIEVKPNVFSPIYVNLRNIISNVMVRKIISQKLADIIKSNPDYICGMESGGSYFASSISDLLNKPLILLRKENKEYGDKKRILGTLPDPGSKIALIDDVIATGLTTSKAITYLSSLGLKTDVYTVFSYGYNKDIGSILGDNIHKISSLITFSNILDSLEDKRMLPKKDIEFLREYTQSYKRFSTDQKVIIK